MGRPMQPRTETTLSAPPRRPMSRVWRVVDAQLPAILAFSGLAVALLTQFLLTDLKGAVSRPAYGFLLAIALYGASALILWSRAKVSDEPSPAVAFELPRKWEIGLVAGVIVLAAFFRFWHFLSFPPGLWYDEAVNATDAFSIMDRDHLTVWRSSNFGHSTIYFYLLIASFKLFGYTLFAMRMVPALAGMAAVVGFYVLAPWLLGPVPAIVATALLALSASPADPLPRSSTPSSPSASCRSCCCSSSCTSPPPGGACSGTTGSVSSCTPSPSSSSSPRSASS